MELGNRCFAHRSEYPIPCGRGWEDEVVRLCNAVDPERDAGWRDYGTNFENDTFAVRQYYWGACTCGAVYPSCDYERQWRAWRVEHHHAPDCPIVLPNFEYKPTGFCLTWYKYPLRDAYMNADISLAEFAKLIDRCIESARGGE